MIYHPSPPDNTKTSKCKKDVKFHPFEVIPVRKNNSRGALAEESVLDARGQVFKNPNFKMQKLGSNDVRLRSYGSIFEALDELYPMGGVPGVF